MQELCLEEVEEVRHCDAGREVERRSADAFVGWGGRFPAGSGWCCAGFWHVVVLCVLCPLMASMRLADGGAAE